MIPMDFFKDEIYEWIPKLASVDLLLVVEFFLKICLEMPKPTM